MNVSKAAKAVVAIVFAVLIAGVQAAQVAMGDDTMSATDWITIALAVLGAAGVYRVPNASDENKDM